MTTIFPAPGTITTNNSYIVNWYIYDKPALQHPSVVKQRSDLFAEVSTNTNVNNLELYQSKSYGSVKTTVTNQTLEYFTVNTDTASWYAFDKNIVTYTTSHASTITLYFVNTIQHVIPFKAGITVRVSSSQSGYSKNFTVLSSNYYSITIDFDVIPPQKLIIDSIFETVYYQDRYATESSLANTNQNNLNRSVMAPLQSPSIRFPIAEHIIPPDNINRLSIGVQTAIAVFRSVTTTHTIDKVTKLKTTIQEVVPPTIPMTLSTYFSDIAGEISFDISSQTPQYVTVDTSIVNWYIYDKDLISHTTRENSTLTLYFKNPGYPQYIPFPTGSTVRVKNKFSQYSNLFVVLSGSKNYVTIDYADIDPVGATIDNMFETVYYQSRIVPEFNTASTSRKNLMLSMTPAISPSIQFPIVEKFAADTASQFLTTIGKQSSVSVYKGVTTNHTVDRITNLKTEIRTVTPVINSTNLEKYNSSSYGEYKFNIISQTPKFVTVNTSSVNWYIFDNNVLTYNTSMLSTLTVYFNNPFYYITPFKTGSTIRISNHESGFNSTFTVLNGTGTSVTIEYVDLKPDNSIIDNITESVYYQSRIVSEYQTASTSRKNALSAVVAPSASPSIQIPLKEYLKIDANILTTNSIEKPISVIKEVTAPVKADIINKAKIITNEITTTINSNSLEKHNALVTGEYTFPVISRTLDLETYNTSVIDSYLFDNDIITTSVRQLAFITLYFDTPYYQQFIPFKTDSQVRISNKTWFLETFTVIHGTTNSITISMRLNMPYDLYIDNIVETVYNQGHTYTSIDTASDSRKKLYYSVMYPNMFINLPIDIVKSSVPDSIVESGNIAKQLLNISTVDATISSANISKQLFNLTTDTANISSAPIDTFKVISDLIDTTVDQSHSLKHYDLLEDGVYVYVLGQPITYDIPTWYINDIDNRLIGVPDPITETTTLIFYHENLWKLFLENQYVRIKQPSANFSHDVLVTSATMFSITFNSIAGFPTNYTGMTINHLYSPVYSKSLVDVPINPETLLLPRENLAAASNTSFTLMFPYGKLTYNSRGTINFIPAYPSVVSSQLPTTTSSLNSYDNIQSGISLYADGQPIEYDVPSWYIKDIDNRLIGVADPINDTITLVFTNKYELCPFLKNQYVRITQPSVGFTQDVLVLSNTRTSITFNRVANFPTNYTGMTINQLYSPVYHQSLVDADISSLINPTNLSLPRENLAASKNPGFISLFPISKLLYNARGTYAISPFVASMGSSAVSNPYLLNSYDDTLDGLTVYVNGQPLVYNVIDWYINDVDNRLIASPVSSSTTTLKFDNTAPIPLFKAGYNVQIKHADTGFVQTVLVTSATMYSITFDSIVGFPTNYTGLTINRLYSPISKQSVIDAQYATLIRPTDLTTAQQNLAASILKPNFRGSQIIFGGIERFSNFAISDDISGKLELFNDTKIPGDFDLAITSSTLISYTTNTTTDNWYTFDELVISYDTVTTDYITLRFNDLGFIPFKTNSTVKIISNNQTFFTTVITGTSSYIIIEHHGNTILSNTRIQRIVSSVYPQDFVSTTVAPVLPRENLYYMRLRSSTPLTEYFQQPVASTVVTSLDKQVTLIKGDSSLNNQQGLVTKYQVKNITTVTDNRPINSLSNITTLKPVIVDNSMLSLKFIPTVVSEQTNRNSGIVDKFLVSRISEIGRETVLTVTTTKISPIQFWN